MARFSAGKRQVAQNRPRVDDPLGVVRLKESRIADPTWNCKMKTIAANDVAKK
jgi:hypothetical protein